MAKENSSGAISTIRNATYKVVNGVTYFKLVSEFDGDYTKNCGLLGNEIDENFYFLRGYDIKSVDYDKETKILTITRVDEDYEPITWDLGQEFEQERPSFAFDKETGILTISYEDGTTETVEGFMVEGSEDISIATDNTLRGKGHKYDPLGLAYTERTGTYAPAFDYFDISDQESEDFGQMPEGMGKGYRVVTKELYNSFGYLYPYSAVQRISEKLENSEWRIPTKEDWDEMLNAMECEDDRNHSAFTSTYLGKFAGRALKSAGVFEEDGEGNVVQHTGAWKFNNVPNEEDATYGEDLRGFKALPVGYSENRNSFMNDHDNDVEGFRTATAYWTNTVDETNGQIYGKIFGYATSQVYQQSFDDDSRLSIRLVKDYDLTNFNEYENILGLYYPTKLITGLHDDLPYAKIWTTVNFYGDKEDLGGVGNDEWTGVTNEDASVKIVYFICEWDGERWHKKQMAEGDSVVILNKDGEENYHEYRIIHGELVDTLDQMYGEFSDELRELKAGLDTLSGATSTFSASVVSEIVRIDSAISGLTDEVGNIGSGLTELSAFTETAISGLTADVDELSGVTEGIQGDVEELSGATEAAISGINESISGLTTNLAKEIENRIAADITPGIYPFNQEGTELPTNSPEIDDVKIEVTDDFFYFGNIIDE